MIKLLLEKFLEIILGLTIVTQVLIPCLVKKLKFFWLFRPDPEPPAPAPQDVKERIQQTKETVTELRNTADIIFEEASKIKDDADSI